MKLISRTQYLIYVLESASVSHDLSYLRGPYLTSVIKELKALIEVPE